MDIADDIDRSGLDSKAQRRRAIIGSSVGTVIELYDFTLYGLASALVFTPLFFPGGGDLQGLLGAFATFVVFVGAARALVDRPGAATGSSFFGVATLRATRTLVFTFGGSILTLSSAVTSFARSWATARFCD